MDNTEASVYLSQFIGKNLRIHTTDDRVFGGQMKCTDKVKPLCHCYQFIVYLVPFSWHAYPFLSSFFFVRLLHNDRTLKLSRTAISF